MDSAKKSETRIAILITGAVSLSNKGTAAIVTTTIELLRQFLPIRKIEIELFFPDKQRNLLSIEDEVVHIVPPIHQQPVRALLCLFAALVVRVLRAFRIPIRVPFQKLRCYDEADLVIDASAEAFVCYYDDDRRQALFRYALHLYPIVLALVLKRPLVIWAQTLGPFGRWSWLMKRLLMRASLVTVRDARSMDHVHRLCGSLDTVHQTADTAVLLAPETKERVEEILTSERIPHVHKGLRIRPVVGLCAARTTGRVLADSEYGRLTSVLAATVRRLILEDNCHVVFVPHSSGRIRDASDDVRVGLDIARLVDREKEFFVIKGDYTPNELKGIIGYCDVLLSFRMHPVIAALSQDVPATIIAFNDKAYSLMEGLGLEQHVCDVRNLSAENLYEQVRLTMRGSIPAAACEAIEAMRRLAVNNARLVAALLQKSACLKGR